MGLLDYLKQGQTALTNATGMDWNKIQADPGANAQALMGGTPMQYNQQPQSLISGGNNPAVNNPVNQPQGPNMPVENPTFTQQSPYTEAVVNAPQSPWGSAPQQGLIGGGSGVDFNQTAPTWGSGYDGTPTEGFKPIDTTLSPDYGVNSNTPVYDTPTDDTDYAATTHGYTEPSDIYGGLLKGGIANPLTATDEEKEEYIRLREAAKAKLPWYLGGTGGK